MQATIKLEHEKHRSIFYSISTTRIASMKPDSLKGIATASATRRAILEKKSSITKEQREQEEGKRNRNTFLQPQSRRPEVGEIELGICFMLEVAHHAYLTPLLPAAAVSK